MTRDSRIVFAGGRAAFLVALGDLRRHRRGARFAQQADLVERERSKDGKPSRVDLTDEAVLGNDMRTFFLFLLGIRLAAAKPYIIFIIAGDLGYGYLGCYGQKTTKTPVLDKLAAEGIRFTQHHSGSTVCAPSRSSLMTGLDTGTT